MLEVDCLTQPPLLSRLRIALYIFETIHRKGGVYEMIPD